MFQVDTLLDALKAVEPPSRIRLAYSGGCDSHVLLHALAGLGERLGAPLCALHVHHGLSPNADAWAEHCQRVCAGLVVPLEVLRVTVTHRGPLGLEAAAREARQSAFHTTMQPGEALLLAHHRDDQAETVLLQILRGAGVRGAAAMPERQEFGPGWMMRPLLGWGRDDLRAYAREHGLVWVEDESNRDERLERNYLRAEILARLSERRPGVGKALARSAGHFAQAREILEERAEEDLTRAGFRRNGRLQADAVADLGMARRCNLLRAWFDRLGLPTPDTARLQRLCTELLQARRDHIPMVDWPGVEVRRYRGELFAHQPLPVHDPALVMESGGATELDLGEACGRLLGMPPANIVVRFRVGGERCATGREGQTACLKRRLQMAGVPPWVRDRIPLLYVDGELLFVPGLGSCGRSPDRPAPYWQPEPRLSALLPTAWRVGS